MERTGVVEEGLKVGFGVRSSKAWIRIELGMI